VADKLLKFQERLYTLKLVIWYVIITCFSKRINKKKRKSILCIIVCWQHCIKWEIIFVYCLSHYCNLFTFRNGLSQSTRSCGFDNTGLVLCRGAFRSAPNFLLDVIFPHLPAALSPPSSDVFQNFWNFTSTPHRLPPPSTHTHIVHTFMEWNLSSGNTFPAIIQFTPINLSECFLTAVAYNVLTMTKQTK
jgi:hypothetical protein